MPEQGRNLPLVTVVTVFYNRSQTVYSSLVSLLNQTYSNLEIIAVDDGSTDGTWAEMQKFEDPRLRLISRPNEGFTKSMIWMIEQARGSIIAVHDAGDISFPERITRQVEVLLNDPEVGVVGCKVLNPIIGTDRIKIVAFPNGLPFYNTLLYNNLFTHGEVVFRKDLYRQVGGYRSEFIFSQDLDLWLRMSKLTKYHIIQDVLYERFEIPGSVSATPQKVLRQQRFSELARQSAENVAKGEQDFVSQHGSEAINHLRYSKRLSEKLMRNAYRAVRMKDSAGWITLAKDSVRESKSPINIAVYLIIRIVVFLRNTTARVS